MIIEPWFQETVVDQKPGFWPSAARSLLIPLSYLYGAFIEAYKLLFRVGVLKRVNLPCRVVSIGNLTMGGVGKTVATQAIARALTGAGYRCVILSYGFRAKRRAEYAVVSDYEAVRISADEAGDEAALLAQSLPGVPVVIGKRRGISGAAAVRLFRPDYILLDDGFQHWRLHRDVDLVLLDARAPFGNGRVFPAGLLREYPAALSRASACVLTRSDRASEEDRRRARETITALAPGKHVYTTSHRTGAWMQIAPHNGSVRTEKSAPHAAWSPSMGPIFVVSAIGQNEAFEEDVRRSGATMGGVRAFPDHHRYSTDDVAAITRDAGRCAAVVTTEKDAVKLAPLWPGEPPLVVVPVDLVGVEPEEWLKLCGAKT